jgi:hypothetical protein
MNQQGDEPGILSGVLDSKSSDRQREERTLNVRQGAFAIVKRTDTLSLLRTGNLGPCVALCGVNERAGVVFMSHVDGNLCGF